ncbi:MAG: aldo/keto reductase [Lachnospiraceae bacterium]|nr:aldo/keto reductase [Lachnospiraceae bacterium]
MDSLKDGYILNNGVRIPCIGLGTYKSGRDTVEAVKTAVQAGYRLIDTAAAYYTEEYVGEGVRQSGVPRGEITVTTKLRNADHGYDATMEAFERSLKKLGFDYIDLYLVHWPIPVQYRPIWEEALYGTWKAFEELYRAGKIRAIGVSNFRPHHFETLMERAEILPMVNQIRLCPGDVHEETVRYCREHGILLEGYSPFGQGAAFKVPELKEIAEKYGKSVAQLCVRWALQNGFVPLPKSGSMERVRANADVFDFEILQEDMEKIAGLTGCCGLAPDPDEIRF